MQYSWIVEGSLARVSTETNEPTQTDPTLQKTAMKIAQPQITKKS